MKLKAIFLSSLVASCLLLGSCNTGYRSLKNGYITVISPAVVLMGASNDAYRGAVDIREGYKSGAWTEIVAFPVLFCWHAVKHVCWVGVHVVDIAFTPFYAVAESSNLGPDIKPIDYYGNTWVDAMYEKHNKKSEAPVDANTGETGR